MKGVFFYACLSIAIFGELSASLYLYNDSPFKLKAVVIAANGTNLSEQVVPPNTQIYVEDQLGSSNPTNSQSNPSFENYNQSLTPYTVFWYCIDGTLYSNCQYVGAGATVMANGCDGSKYCKPAKPQHQTPETLTTPQ